MTDFYGKNVLITGCASGIGRLMAQRAAVRGGHVIMWDINELGLRRLQEQLDRWGHRSSYYLCDMSDRAAIQRTATQALAEHGPIEILINNVGIVSGKKLLELSDEAILRSFQVNTLSLFWTTRAFLPAMLENNSGHVVTIASAGGLIGAPKLSDYSASKFAAVGFDDVLRQELARDGGNVRTTVVCPYYIDTGMFSGVKTRFPSLLPILKPEDVADRVIRAVLRNEQRVLLPPFVAIVFPGRLLPPALFDQLAAFFGINKTMDEFTGRDGHR